MTLPEGWVPGAAVTCTVVCPASVCGVTVARFDSVVGEETDPMADALDKHALTCAPLRAMRRLRKEAFEREQREDAVPEPVKVRRGRRAA